MSLLERGDPDFINGKGIKWWLDEISTRHAREENIRGTTLPDISAWYVEFPDGDRQYVLVDKQEPIYETQSYSQLAEAPGGVWTECRRQAER